MTILKRSRSRKSTATIDWPSHEACQRSVEPFDCERAVRQFGERVVQREVTELAGCARRGRGRRSRGCAPAPSSPARRRTVPARCARRSRADPRAAGRRVCGSGPTRTHGSPRSSQLAERLNVRESGLVLDVRDDDRLEAGVVRLLGAVDLRGVAIIDRGGEVAGERRRRDALQRRRCRRRRGGSSPTRRRDTPRPLRGARAAFAGTGVPARTRSRTCGFPRAEGFGTPALGDVAEVAHDASHRRLVHLVRARRLGPPPRAVAVPAPELDELALQRTVGERGDGRHRARRRRRDGRTRRLGAQSSDWVRSRRHRSPTD